MGNAFCDRDMDKPALTITGWMAMLFGGMLLTGEYLCVEVAWRCMEYDQFRVGFAGLMLSVGMISTMIGINDD